MHHGDVSPDIAAGLLALKKRIEAAKIPPSQLDQSINVAIWNIREFGKKRRTEAAIHYIAEILGQFDLIALVELRDNLTDYGRVCQFLGPSWDLVYSDWMSDPGGNRERVGFLFDRRAVTFNGLAAEVDAPRTKKGRSISPRCRSGGRPTCAPSAPATSTSSRSPPMRAGATAWKAREAELGMLADWIDLRFKDKAAEDTDLIVMGDFNTPSLDDKIFKALTRRGLQIPNSLVDLKVGEHHGQRLQPRQGRALRPDPAPADAQAALHQLRRHARLLRLRRRHQGAIPGRRLFAPGVHLPALRPLPDLGADRHRHRRPAADADRAERQEVIGTPPGPTGGNDVQLWMTTVAAARGAARTAQEIEAAGWDGMLVVDSQNLSGDPYVALALAATATTRLGLGHRRHQLGDAPCRGDGDRHHQRQPRLERPRRAGHRPRRFGAGPSRPRAGPAGAVRALPAPAPDLSQGRGGELRRHRHPAPTWRRRCRSCTCTTRRPPAASPGSPAAPRCRSRSRPAAPR